MEPNIIRCRIINTSVQTSFLPTEEQGLHFSGEESVCCRITFWNFGILHKPLDDPCQACELPPPILKEGFRLCVETDMIVVKQPVLTNSSTVVPPTASSHLPSARHGHYPHFEESFIEHGTATIYQPAGRNIPEALNLYYHSTEKLKPCNSFVVTVDNSVTAPPPLAIRFLSQHFAFRKIIGFMYIYYI